MLRHAQMLDATICLRNRKFVEPWHDLEDLATANAFANIQMFVTLNKLVIIITVAPTVICFRAFRIYKRFSFGCNAKRT